MQQSEITSKKGSFFLDHLPSIGILLSIILYAFGTQYYPGGSDSYMEAEGYSWIHNYWCTLMSVTARNGVTNPARGIAIVGHVLLCLSFAGFFYRFSRMVPVSSFWKIVLPVSGILCMTACIFFFSDYHDIMIPLASFAGLFVLVGLIGGLARFGMKVFLIPAIIIVVLLALNNYLYYTEHFIYALPLLQKFSMILTFGWVIAMNTTILKKDFSESLVV